MEFYSATEIHLSRENSKIEKKKPFVSRVTSMVYVIVLRVYLKLFDKRLYFSLCTSEEKKSKYFSYSDSFIIDHNQPNSFLKGKVSNRLDT